MKMSVLTMAVLGLAISSCSEPASDKPADQSGKKNAAPHKTSNDAAAIEQDANSIKQAAEKATALIEAESRAEIKAMGGQAGDDTKNE
jgi:hypothetical protein